MKDLRAKLEAITNEIINTVVEKDAAYGSSWKSHGGFSAFFNLDRKYSRIQNMAEKEGYNLFAAVHTNPDGPDTLQDLVAYALLTLTETYSPPGYVDPEDVDHDRIGDTPMTGVEEPRSGKYPGQ